MGQRPSALIGLQGHTYEAYCLDEAVVFFGMSLENMLDEAGDKPGKAERKAKAARTAIMDKVFNEGDEVKSSGFADPAVMFQ